MDRQLIFWTLAFSLGLLAWTGWDLAQMHIYYKWHDYLIDQRTGERTEPRQLIDFGKIINVSETYVNTTNALERLYDVLYQTNLESLLPLNHIYSNPDQLKVSGWPVSNQTRCGQELDWILDKLRQNPQYQLLRGQLGRELTTLMDSFGKFESGTYSGLTFWLGSYKHCLRASLNGGAIRTRYCVAKMRPKWWPEQERVHPKSRISIGVCLPETCDTSSFKLYGDKMEQLTKLELPDFASENLIFDDLYCLPDERSPMRRIPPAGWLLLYLLAAWLAAVMMASCLYSGRKNGNRATSGALEVVGLAKLKCQREPINVQPTGGRVARKLIAALAVQKSWKAFVSDEFGRRARAITHQGGRLRLDLRCLNFIKFTMTLFIIMAHTALLVSIEYRSISERIEISVQEEGRAMASLGRCVDTFFMLFGLLIAYNLLKRFSVDQLARPSCWLAANIGILLRVGPLYALAYWFARLVVPFLGAGPWWDYGTFKSSLRGLCMAEPWYKSIPQLGQSGEPHLSSCVAPGWFIVSYTQIGLLVPLMTYLMWRLPGHFYRLLLIGYTIFIATLQMALKLRRQTTIREEAFMQYGGFLFALLEKFESTGTMAALGRVCCVAVGCYVGYLLRMYELGAISEWPRWLVSGPSMALVFVSQSLIVLLPLIGYWLTKNSGRKSTSLEFIAGYMVSTSLWLLVQAVQVICLCTTYNRARLVQAASHKMWHALNKLGYALFLIHFELILLGLSSHEQAPSHGFRLDSWKLFGLVVIFALPVSLLLHLLIEAPLSRLLQLLTSIGRKRARGGAQSGPSHQKDPAAAGSGPVQLA